jgi:glycine/D-amino acid oxidase-like deaminating enzyme
VPIEGVPTSAADLFDKVFLAQLESLAKRFVPNGAYAGVKVATEQSEQATTPGTMAREVSVEETARTFATHVRHRLSGLQPESVHDATCLYTSTADGRFVIGRDPALPRLTIVSACSGHGFKHSAAVGEAVADACSAGYRTWTLGRLRPCLSRPLPRRGSPAVAGIGVPRR